MLLLTLNHKIVKKLNYRFTVGSSSYNSMGNGWVEYIIPYASISNAIEFDNIVNADVYNNGGNHRPAFTNAKLDGLHLYALTDSDLSYYDMHIYYI